MIQSVPGEAEDGLDVFCFEVGVVVEDLVARRASRQKVEYVRDSNRHAADTRTATAPVGVHSDAVIEVRHGAPPDAPPIRH